MIIHHSNTWEQMWEISIINSTSNFPFSLSCVITLLIYCQVTQSAADDKLLPGSLQIWQVDKCQPSLLTTCRSSLWSWHEGLKIIFGIYDLPTRPLYVSLLPSVKQRQMLSFHFSKETELENTLLKTVPENMCLALYRAPTVWLLTGNLNI